MRTDDARYQAAARAISPLRVLLITVGVFLATLPLAPIIPKVPPSLGGMLFGGLVFLAAAFGLALAQGPWSRDRVRDRPFPQFGGVIRWTLLLGVTGTVLLMLDRYLVRHVPLGLDIMEARKSLQDSDAGPLSTLAAGLAAFSLFGPVLISISEALGQPVRRGAKALAWSSVGIYLVASILLGTRSLFTVFMIMLLLTRFYARALSGPGPRRRSRLWVYLLALLVLVIFGVVMMLARLQQMGLDPLWSIQLSGYAETVRLSPWLVDFMYGHPGVAPIAAALMSLVLYVYHGLFEFFLLFDQFGSAHTWGAMLGWLPLKLVGSLTGQNLMVDPDTLEGVRVGVYTTFLGPAYIDFGWFAVPAVTALFFGLGWPVRLLRAGRPEWLPWVVTVSTICAMFPVLNLMESATGAYPLVAAALIPVLARLTSPRRAPGVA